MSSKNKDAAGAGFWAEMSARIDAEENANKKTDNFDAVQYAKGLYLKWDSEAQAAKKANPLEVLAERNREARSREKEAQQMPPEDNRAVLRNFTGKYMQNYRDHKNGH